jgi:hypothetical protein
MNLSHVDRPFTEEEVRRRLRELERRWPDHLMLFGSSGRLYLLTRVAYQQQGIDGQESFSIPTDGGAPTCDTDDPAHDVLMVAQEKT